MRSALIPLQEGAPVSFAAFEGGEAFAVLPRAQAVALTRAMPDARSAVLFCLGWEAARQVRFTKGPYAVQPIARLSARALVELTGRPLRTIRWALAKLVADRLVQPTDHRPGRTNIYRLTLDAEKASSRDTRARPRRAGRQRKTCVPAATPRAACSRLFEVDI